MPRRTHIRLPFGRRLPPVGEEFVSVEALGSLGLLAAAGVALVWANIGDGYAHFWGRHLTIGIGALSLTDDVRHWVNDGLMAVFFFVVGLEIKRELVRGELRDPRRAALPAIAALGGMVVPALLFVAVNPGVPERDGWGIPMASDLAFAVGVLVLLGSRVPPALKLFLLTLAVVDDIGSILVIAAFYSGGLSIGWLAAAAATLLVFFTLRALGAHHPLAYVLPGVALWLCASKSGLNGSLAGVALGMLAPGDTFHGRPVIDGLERHLHPWTTFLVVPLFALANAGVDLRGGVLGDALWSPVALGVVAARIVGKPLGIVLAAEVALRLRLARLPPGVGRRHVLGAGALAGIGFTVALVVTDLSYAGTGLLGEAKVGLFTSALASGALGAILLVGRTRPARTMGA